MIEIIIQYQQSSIFVQKWASFIKMTLFWIVKINFKCAGIVLFDTQFSYHLPLILNFAAFFDIKPDIFLIRGC